MKDKIKMVSLIIVVLLLVHVILIVGCGKNPLLGTIGSSLNVGVGSLNFLTSMKGSTSWLAHNSAGPESFIVMVEQISVGDNIVIWKGSQEVDLAKITSFADIPTFKGDVPSGKYQRFEISSNSYPKVKGSVVVDGKTYYTKTNHTNYDIPPAELEEIHPINWGDGGGTWKFSLITELAAPIQIGGNSSVSDIYVLLDIAYTLTYYDGDPITSGLQPGQTPLINNKTDAGLYLLNPPFAFTFGKPAKKEVYHYTVVSSSEPNFSPGTGRLTFLFDSSDNLIGASPRQLLINNEGSLFNLGDGAMNSYITGLGIGNILNPDSFQKNADGTYRIQMELKDPNSGYTTMLRTTVLKNFQRSSHTGNFTYRNGITGESITGTYTATRTE